MSKTGRLIGALSATAVILASIGVFDVGVGRAAGEGDTLSAADDQTPSAPVEAPAETSAPVEAPVETISPVEAPAELVAPDGPPALGGPDVPRWPLDGDSVVRDAEVGVPVVLTIDLPGAGGFEGLLRFDEEALDFGGAATLNGEATLIQTSIGGAGAQLSVFDTDGRDASPVTVEMRFVPATAGDIMVEFDVQSVVGLDGASQPSAVTLRTLLRVAGAGGRAIGTNFDAPVSDVQTAPEPADASDVVSSEQADVNGDGVVDDVDLAELRVELPALVAAGDSCALGSRGLERLDMTGDGCLSVADFSAVSQLAAAAPAGPTTLPATFPNLVLVVDSIGDEGDVSTADNACRTAGGACTLRAAIQQANATPGPNRIEFAIAGSGPHEIVVDTTVPLPTINDTTGGLTIDGYSQPGATPNTDPFASNAVLKVAVSDGTLYSNSSERSLIKVTSANNVIRGLAIYRCFYCINYDGAGANGNLVAGNWIGTNTAGTFAMGSNSHTNQASVKYNRGAHHNRLGTPELSDRNVISGQRTWGVRVEQWPTEYTYIQNNLFGYRPDGTNRLTTLGAIDAQWSSARTIIGGTGRRERNMFAGSTYAGVDFSHLSNNNQLIGNYFGTSVDGTSNPGTWARTSAAVWIKDDSYNHTISGNVIVNSSNDGIHVKHNYNRPLTIIGNWIGVLPNGTAAGNLRHGILLRGRGSVVEGNIIANNTGDGVFLDDYVEDTTPNLMPGLTEGNRVSRNSFYSNGGLGVDILNQGGSYAAGNPNPAGSSADNANTINPNDPADVDTGVQQLLNHPEFGATDVGTVTGTACAGCTVEVYLQNPSSVLPQGRQYLGSGVADASGAFTVTDARITSGTRVTALTIDTNNNTSEFAPVVTIVGQFVPSALPTLADPGAQLLAVGQPFQLTLGASPVGVTFSALHLPAGLTLDALSGVVAGTPTAAGVFDVVLRADNAQGSSVVPQTWTVIAPPTPPVLAAVSSRQHRVGDVVAVDIDATDTNGDPIVFSASGLPAGLGIDVQSGVISGAVTAAGRYVVGVTATAGGESDTEWFTWHVSDGAVISGVAYSFGPGGVNREQRVTGTGLVAGSTLSFGDGTTVNQTVSSTDTLIVLRMSVAETALPGLRDLVVTAPGGAVSYCVGCFRVTAAPVVTSITPSIWAPGSTPTVQVNGTFSWGTTVTVAGSGITLGSITATGTLVSFNATVASNAATGVRQLAIRHGDQGVTRVNVLIGSATPALPGVPTGVSATPASGQASISFVAPTSGGAVLSYLVRATNLTDASRGGQQVTGIGSPIVVPGLTNGDQYRFTVTALNPAGPGPISASSNTVIPISPLPPLPSAHVPNDFDGDGSSDRVVFRPAVGGWYVQGQTTTFLGVGSDVPVPGDYDGDGAVEAAVYRSGAWYVEGQTTTFLGVASDIPVPGDYDGDGTWERAVYRGGVWFVEGEPAVFLGVDGDVPVPGDYDGDGIWERAVYRPSIGGWYVEGQATSFHGLSSDIPVPGDFDGDGAWERTVFRPSVGGWYVDGAVTVFLGLSGDVPVAGDYDGDGAWERAVFRPEVGGWYVEGAPTEFHGLSSDVPIGLPQATYRAYF